MTRCLRHAIVVHENVADFPVSEFMDFLSDLYLHVRLSMDARNSGFAACRLRVWDIMILRALVDPLLRTVPRNLERLEWFVKTLFFCECSFDWTEFLQASADEFEEELEWALSRKLTKEFNDMHNVDIAKAKKRGTNVALLALNPSERCRLVTYKAMRPGRVYDVGQEPTERPISSDAQGRMPTLMHGMGLMFFDDTTSQHTRPNVPARWMTASELFESMGFPIQERLQRICCGAQHAYSHGRPWRPHKSTRNTMSQQIGNSQHVGVIGPIHFALLLLFPIVQATDAEANENILCPDGRAEDSSADTTAIAALVPACPQKRPLDSSSSEALRQGSSLASGSGSSTGTSGTNAFRADLRKRMRTQQPA